MIDEYLKYLQEVDASEFIKSNIKSGAKYSILFGLVATPALVGSWKLANQAFSQAYRKCGGFTKRSTPGFKVCVSKERIKILQQKITILSQVQCNKSKNPDLCKQQIKLKIEKAKNRIEVEKNKITEILGEQKNIQEIAPVLAGAAKAAVGIGSTVGGLAIMTVAGAAADKAMFIALRSASALFSSATRKCGIYKKKGPERELCISKIKLVSLNKQLAIYRNLLNNCNKKRNPDICKQKIQQKIEKVSRDIEIQNNNLKAFSREIEIEKKEKEFKQNVKIQK